MKTLTRKAKVARTVILVALPAVFCASCASITDEQRIANEQSRRLQQEKGFFDRESSAQQKSADTEAEWLRQQRRTKANPPKA